MDHSTSFATRRPAASGLPTFTLPTPSPAQDIPRVSGDGLSPSPGVNSGSSQSSQPGYYSHVPGQWPTPGGGTPYAYSSAAPNPAHPALAQPPYGGGRTLFSPSMPYNHHRDSQSPATAGGVAPPPPFQNAEVQSYHPPLSGGGGQPTLSSQQPPPSQLQNPILGSQGATTQAPTAPSSAAGDFRPPPTPYSPYPPSSAQGQGAYPAYAPQPSPTQPSPTTSATTPRGLSSMTQGPPLTGMAPPMGYGPSGAPRPGYPYHPVSGGVGPVMSNIGNPGGQMALVPGMAMAGYGHHGPHGPHMGMYGSHSQPTTQERPFKCDVCPQSFNRNHDLKRHKRIHLSVKPYPCTFCDKSFSRKDALKRHRLVKGCGEKAAAAAAAAKEAEANAARNASPPSRSDGPNESPKTTGLKAE